MRRERLPQFFWFPHVKGAMTSRVRISRSGAPRVTKRKKVAESRKKPNAAALMHTSALPRDKPQARMACSGLRINSVDEFADFEKVNIALIKCLQR
jgi:hypothetical protein